MSDTRTHPDDLAARIEQINAWLDRQAPPDVLDVTYMGVRLGDMPPEMAQRIAGLILTHQLMRVKVQGGDMALARDTVVPEDYFGRYLSRD